MIGMACLKQSFASPSPRSIACHNSCKHMGTMVQVIGHTIHAAWYTLRAHMV